MSYIVVTAKTQDLRKARRALRRKGYRAYIPALSGCRLSAKGGRLRRRRQITLLMSYILVEAPDARIQNLWLHDVLSTDKVQGYLKSNEAPAMVPAHVVKQLSDSVARMILVAEAASVKRRLRKGGKAIVKEGPLAGKRGVVTWVSGQRAKIEAMVFGSMRVVEVRLSQLEAA